MDDVDWRPGDDLDERLAHALGASVMLGSGVPPAAAGSIRLCAKRQATSLPGESSTSAGCTSPQIERSGWYEAPSGIGSGIGSNWEG